jgi:hypothetical protein
MDPSSSQSLVTFEHDTFQDAAGYLRLLRVLDVNHTENNKVQCEMTTWPINNTPSYHAISYTWGDPRSNTTILINGRVFQVRTNCEFVLIQAYGFEKTNYYWVDAICINQGNLEEKGMQVSIMGSIYKRAAHVLACVGDHAGDSEFLVHKLKQRPFTKKRYRGSSPTGLSLRFQLGQRFSTTMRFLHAVDRFLERQYFSRLWILQELHNSQGATFLCGSDSIPKHLVYDMSDGISNHANAFDASGIVSTTLAAFTRKVPVLRRFGAMREYWWKSSNASKEDERLYHTARRAYLFVGPRNDLWTLIDTAALLQCQEKKDKIFGLLSLVDWGSFGSIIPDYTQTDFEVAVVFLRALLNAWKDQRGTLNLWNIPGVCSDVADLLELDINSDGVPRALESRRVEPGSSFVEEATAIEFAHSRHSISTGWLVSSEHLARSNLGFSIWSPLGSDKSKTYLPAGTKGGDWVVAAGFCSFTRFVVVREAAEGFTVVGHAISDGIDTEKVTSAKFGIHWDAEDLVVYSVVQNEMRRLGTSEVTKYSVEWLRALNTAVCKKQTPGSSYAVRCDDTSCEL